MSHIVELALVFTDQAALESALAEFGVTVERNIHMKTTRKSQHFATERDRLPLVVAGIANGEMLGFRERDLTDAEREGLVDKSESSRSVRPATRGLIPVGDYYYGGIEKTFGKRLCKLQGRYYAESLRRTFGRATRITVTETDQEVFVEADIA